ncbi:MAG: response regulator, partial [Candidatus Competibacterales bacterium]
GGAVHRARPPGPPGSPHVTTGDRPPGLLWLIEDDHELLEATSLLLKSHGYRVQTFTSGDDAVAAAQVAPTPQLVISDYLLPGAHSGLDTIYQLRQRLDAALPALIVTGAAERLVGGTGLDNVAVMSKPIQLQRLQAAIRRLLAADCGATG